MSAAIKKNGLLFLQLHKDLLERIRKGEFPIESQLPTESELIEHYRVSITTVRKAVQLLADEGIVSKRQGMGTFVLRRPERSDAVKTQPLKIAVFLPNTMKLRAEGDSRHWALNVRRLNGIYSGAANSNAVVFVHGFGEKVDPTQFDGVICMPSYAYDLDSDDLRRRLAEELESKRIPFVTISEFDPRFASKHWIVELIEYEFYKAVNYLIDCGRTKIALIGPALSWSNPRYTAYRKALNNAGIEYREELVVDNPESDSESGYGAASSLFMKLAASGSVLANLDAIMCTTDLQAFGVLKYLAERDVAVPEAISVMGVDNLTESANSPIPLTSMEFSGADIGRRSFELLVDVINGKYSEGITISYPGKIFVRGTVC